MPTVDEATLRAALDARGLLRDHACLAPPARDTSFLVFAQRNDARIELAAWQRHAAAFFATKLGLTTEKKYGEDGFPRTDAARVAIACGDVSGARFIFARPREPADLAEADAADRDRAGLAELARRCGTVWLVACDGEPDRVALRVAAILSGVLLGPIVAPRGASILGPKSARALLE